MPTRLLELGPAEHNENTIRVVLCSGLSSNVDYMTLSHCWGPRPPIRLTRANMKSMTTGISVQDLPKSFRDAIIVTRWFHYRYLWVDSLCIVQDSTEDWQTESGTMRHVYKNATLNIAATSAIDSSSGLFFKRNPSLVSAGTVSVSWSGGLPQGTFYFFPRTFWEHGVSRAPLNRRAWVVQERFLSRRNLHFGSRGIYFECHELEACETFPRRLPTLLSARLRNRIKEIDMPEVGTATARAEAFLRNWLKIIQAYMDSELTFASDKMIALSGVAEEFRKLHNYTYLAGLWEECYLTDQLLWHVNPSYRGARGRPSARPSIYRAPSWSWLSLDAQISGPVTIKPSLIKILDAKTELIDASNPTGPVKQGMLRVRGKLESVHLQKILQTRDKYSTRGVDNKVIGIITLKLDEGSFRPTQAYCMPVRFIRADTLQGLLLVPTEQGPAEFKRVGLFESDDDETHERLAKRNSGDEILFTIV